MEPEAKRVLEVALTLRPETRARIAAELIESLDHPTLIDSNKAWRLELARRMRETDEGRSQPIPWSVAKPELLD